MMQLFIDDRPCEADVSSSVSLRFDSADLSAVDSGRAGDHINLVIPSTPENDEIFCNAADMQSAEKFNSEHHTARIEADGIEIFSGTAYFDGAEMSGGALFYRLEIIGGATQWAKQAGRRMFNLINIKCTMPLDMVGICNSWTNDSPVRFLPVKRTNDSLSNGQTTIYVPEKILTPEDYHPFLSVEAMCRAIFKSAGYKIESRFFESDLFRSLYMSGAYSTTDTNTKLSQMDFLAGRMESVTAQANFAGRVYASPAVAANSLGNIVDTVSSEIIDGEGNVVATGFYSRNGCFTIDDDGFVSFRPLTAATVGFEYALKFACDYRMESRNHLCSFDHIYLGEGVTLPFKLTNRFKDYREALRSDFQYRLVIFDHSEEYQYELRYKVDGVWRTWRELYSKSEIVISPSDIGSADEVALYRVSASGGPYSRATEDWALYEGSVGYEGSIEAEITLRIPAVDLSPTSPKRFDSIYFGGAESGMKLTLLPGTTLRPIFTSAIGYGSVLEFADVAQIDARQGALLDAVRQMFNLRFYTDERLKTVYIEPYDDFICRNECYDWSDHIDYGEPIIIEEIARSVHERQTLGYREADGVVQQYNSENDTEFGEWSFDITSRGSIQGEKALANALFAPTISRAGDFVNAESALVMQLQSGGSSGSTIDTEIVPRIVRYVGMKELPEGELWGYPYSEANYPMAAFHYAGDDSDEGFTLCFEDRDDCVGLNGYYKRQFAEENGCRYLSLTMRILPEEFDYLFHFVEGKPSIRSAFVLKINGVAQRYRLHAIERYNPSTGEARCTFAQIETEYV